MNCHTGLTTTGLLLVCLCFIVPSPAPAGETVRLQATADNADALRFHKLSAWRMSEFRRALAKLITAKK